MKCAPIFEKDRGYHKAIIESQQEFQCKEHIEVNKDQALIQKLPLIGPNTDHRSDLGRGAKDQIEPKNLLVIQPVENATILQLWDRNNKLQQLTPVNLRQLIIWD